MANGLCSNCEQPLDSSHRSYCRKCAAEYAQRWRNENPGKQVLANRKYQQNNPEAFRASKKKWRLKSIYGLSLEEFNAMLEAQAGGCAACSVPLVEFSKARDGLVVDHNHETGEVRGLLCNTCNMALGLLGDDPSRIAALGRYCQQFVTPHIQQEA